MEVAAAPPFKAGPDTVTSPGHFQTLTELELGIEAVKIAFSETFEGVSPTFLRYLVCGFPLREGDLKVGS